MLVSPKLSPKLEKEKAPIAGSRINTGGAYWFRTSDLLNVSSRMAILGCFDRFGKPYNHAVWAILGFVWNHLMLPFFDPVAVKLLSIMSYGIYIEKWMPQSPGGILFFLYSGIYANPDTLPFPHRWYTSPFLS